MARATRSTAANTEKEKDGGKEKEKHPQLSPRTKLSSKKRKRGSINDTDDLPAVKQHRSEPSINPDDTPDSDSIPPKDSSLPQLQNAGDLPIDPTDAQKILDILEMIDTQGLLDRVFPLPIESSTAQPASLSFRTLLQDPSQHSLSVLRSAVRHLFPISSHPRSRPSTPAAQQLQFCELALSLLDQASFHSVPFPLDIETILPPPPESSSSAAVNIPNGDSKAPRASTVEPPSPPPPSRQKYALMQRLSNGEWWTSLNSDNALPFGKEFKDLNTAHAELVVIFPGQSVADPASTPDVPTIHSLTTQKTAVPKSKVLGPRRMGCGTFLDYGPFASFAPSFDQDGSEIGRRVLGEVLWNSEEKKRKRRAKSQVPARPSLSEPVDVIMDDDVQECPPSKLDLKEEAKSTLESLLPSDEITSFTSALGCLELECAVQELLQRNNEALKRLGELQRLRLSAEDGGSSQAEEGSEEWDTAQEIMNSLTLLASLRPRSSKDPSKSVPPPSVLRRLSATLPLSHAEGWYGTLATRTTALRDDSTLRLRSGATLPATATPSTASAATTSTPTVAAAAASTSAGTTVPASVYPSYAYSNYAASQYRSGYTPYKPGQTPTYYPPTYSNTPGQGQTGTQTYYGNQGYSGQQAYPYGSWYSYQPTASAGTASGRGTPQPSATTASPTPSTLATNYAGFFSNTAQSLSTATQRAVANTVVGSKTISKQLQAGSIIPSYPPLTLPPYLRSAASSTSQPPSGTSTTGYQANYFGSYAQPSSAAE